LPVVPDVIGRQLPCEVRITARQQRLVVDLAQFAAARRLGVAHLDHFGALCFEQRQCFFEHRRVFAIAQQQPRAAVPKHEGDRFGVEARVQRIEHRAAHRDAEMRFEHGWHVGQHRRHRIATAYAPRRQCAAQAPAAAIGLRPGLADRTMDQRDPVRVDAGRAFDEAQRRQRHEIGLVAVQTDVVRIAARHGRLSCLGACQAFNPARKAPSRARIRILSPCESSYTTLA
jgi:hypothetical protein